jgi:hypothetical protein
MAQVKTKPMLFATYALAAVVIETFAVMEAVKAKG